MAKIIRLKKLKTRHKFKYALNEQVGMLPRNMNINQLIDHLARHGISRNEFYADRKIPFGSESSIPSDRLFIYASVFDVPVTDLLNQQINASSIRQKNIKLKSGLI